MKRLMKDIDMPSVDEYITMIHKMGIALEEETSRSEVESLSGAIYFLNLAR
jgi:hypothetical protein